MEDDLKHTKLSIIRLTFWLTKCDRGDTKARKSLFYQARTFMRAAQSLKSHHQTRRFGFRHGSNARRLGLALKRERIRLLKRGGLP